MAFGGNSAPGLREQLPNSVLKEAMENEQVIAAQCYALLGNTEHWSIGCWSWDAGQRRDTALQAQRKSSVGRWV